MRACIVASAIGIEVCPDITNILILVFVLKFLIPVVSARVCMNVKFF